MIKSVPETLLQNPINLEKEVSNLEQEFEQELHLLKRHFLKAPEDAVAYALKIIKEASKEGTSLSEC